MEKEAVKLPANNTEEKKKQIHVLLEKGLCNREIAEATGIPMGTVSYHATNWRRMQKGVPKPKKQQNVDNTDRHLCKTCIYRSNKPSVNICDFCDIEKHGRGCTVEHCTKYKRGARKKRKETEGDMD